MPTRVSRPPEKPLLIFDGDCGFCRHWIRRWEMITAGRVDYVPSQEAAPRFPEIPPEDFARSVQFVEPDGTVTSGAEAVFRSLAAVPGRGRALAAYRRLPGFAAASEWFYGLVARRRTLFSRITTWLWGPSLEPSTYVLSRWLFLRLLGFVYLFAFASLGFQIIGLAGGQGILPAADFLQALRERLGPERYLWVPTICWWNAGDAFLCFLCWGGAALAATLISGLAPRPVLVLLWVFYLSIVSVGRDFLSFQWDSLLLETGFLAVFLAPGGIFPRPSRERQPPSAALWLFRWLLFRLMFSSGAIKLLSGDASWRSLASMTYHYWTQPLPTWIGWYAHQLPVWFQKFSVADVLLIELAVPFLIFAPRRPRFFACGILVLFQALILLTGNFGFFNLLTIALCLLLLDDRFFTRWLPGFRAPAQAQAPAPAWRRRLLGAAAAAIFIAGGLQAAAQWGLGSGGSTVFRLLRFIAPFHIVNNYGLFAVMTTERPEIVVEGSADGRTWLPYEFKWKPGDLRRRPGFVAPHQPRLDWQMWFAALGDIQNNPWFVNFLLRLLQGSPPVLEMLEKNPFPEAPPKFLRALVYNYRFTDPEIRRREGAWWRRELRGIYCRPVSLRAG